MNNLLHSIDMNIMRKKLEIMNKEMEQLQTQTLVMDYQSKEIKKTYDKLLYKKEPVGSTLAAVKHLKQYR